MLLESLPALLPQPLEHLPEALEALPVHLEAGLEDAAQGGVGIAMLDQLVAQGVEQGVGVEVRDRLGAVPARIGEAPRLAATPAPAPQPHLSPVATRMA